MVLEFQLTIYMCSYCTRVDKTQHDSEGHETTCGRNIDRSMAQNTAKSVVKTIEKPPSPVAAPPPPPKPQQAKKSQPTKPPPKPPAKRKAKQQAASADVPQNPPDYDVVLASEGEAPRKTEKSRPKATPAKRQRLVTMPSGVSAEVTMRTTEATKARPTTVNPTEATVLPVRSIAQIQQVQQSVISAIEQYANKCQSPGATATNSNATTTPTTTATTSQAPQRPSPRSNLCNLCKKPNNMAFGSSTCRVCIEICKARGTSAPKKTQNNTDTAPSSTFPCCKICKRLFASSASLLAHATVCKHPVVTL